MTGAVRELYRSARARLRRHRPGRCPARNVRGLVCNGPDLRPAFIDPQDRGPGGAPATGLRYCATCSQLSWPAEIAGTMPWNGKP